MKYKLILQFLTLVFSTFSYSQEIVLKGLVLDDSLGAVLKPQIYANFEGNKILMKRIDMKDVFQVTLPVETDSLYFEVPNYQYFKIPLHFEGDFSKRYEVTLSLEISQKDYKSPDISSLTFLLPDNLSHKVQILHYLNDTLHCVLPAFGQRKEIVIPLRNVGSGSYQLALKDGSEAKLFTKKIKPFYGLTYVAINLDSLSTQSYNQTANLVKNKILETEIFFDKSKYDLSEVAKFSLDSLALEILSYNPAINIVVQGFTDGVGDKKSNNALASYRAKVVANYLQIKGIKSENIMVKWVSIKTNSGAEDENALKKRRKVVIQSYFDNEFEK